VAKDNMRDRIRALGGRARALLGRVTAEEIQHAEADSEPLDVEIETRAQVAAREVAHPRNSRDSAEG
jgi:hypothetical protein